VAFENITTIDGWSAALKELLDRARSATTQDDRLNISIELTDYQIASIPPDSTDAAQAAAIQQFDRIAREAAEKILIDDISERAQAIAGRAGELAAATKAFRAQAEKNERAAETLKLTPVTRAIKGATELIDSIREVRASLGAGEEADKLRERLERLVKSVQEFRNSLERGEADPVG
jgi:hypothetical protein